MVQGAERRDGTRRHFVVEAAGVQIVPPKVEPQPDPTNVTTVRQAWDCTRMGGHVMLMGLTLRKVPLPGVSLALLGRTIHPGQQGGLHMMRDLPRFVKLIERGRLDAKSMITKTTVWPRAGRPSRMSRTARSYRCNPFRIGL